MWLCTNMLEYLHLRERVRKYAYITWFISHNLLIVIEKYKTVEFLLKVLGMI